MNSPQLPMAFEVGKTPEVWCKILAEMHGIRLSPRKVRRVARRTGNFSKFGRNMLLLPEHIDKISAEMALSQ